MIDIIGQIPQLPGWHVNSIEPIVGAEAFLVTPENHFRKFSGVAEFYCYRFDSKQHALDYLPQEGAI